MIFSTRFSRLALVAGLVASAQVWGQSANPELPPAPLANPNLPADSVSAAVGASRGEFRVTESGAASYSIAAMTAPSGGGMTPQIALAYSSQGGNGAAGQGWNISGLSSITRCAQTLEAGDPRPVGVTLSASDRFCLDGQRLILVSGVYGANNAEYRLAVDQIVRVRSFGAVAGGPAWFKVWRKDGSTSWYGASDDAGAAHPSRVMSKTTVNPVFAWNVARIQDSAGNYMLIDWQDRHTTGVRVETVPTAVRYGGNAALTPNNEIRFDWAIRPVVDQLFGFVAGAELASTARLTAIRSLGGGAEIRRYSLAYRASTNDTAGRSTLASITECRGMTCYPATLLTWNTAQLALGGLSTATPINFSLPSAKTVTYQTPDVNGDGMADFISLEKQTSSLAPRFRLALSLRATNGTLSFTAPSNCAVVADCPLMGGGVRSDLSVFPRWVLMDVDGNGYNDIVYAYQTPNTTTRRFYAHFWDGTRFGPAVQVGSFAAQANQLQAFDWDGDGRSDLMYDSGQGRMRVARNAGYNTASPLSTFAEQATFTVVLQSTHFPNPPGTSMLGHYDIRFAAERIMDANGDGLADVVLEVRELYCPPGCGIDIYGKADPEQLAAAAAAQKAPGNEAIQIGGTAIQGRFILFEMRWNATALRHELVSRTVLARSADDAAGGFSRASEIRMTDLNGDGNSDFVFFNLDASRWDYRINPGMGGFKAARAITNWPTDAGLRKYVQFADVTGDGHPDALIPSASGSGTAVWRVSAWDRGLDSGNGNFGVLTTTTAQSGSLTGGANSVFADFNGDGKLDQLQTTIDNGNVRVRRGWGRNSLTGSSTYEGIFLLRRIADGFGAWSDFSYKSLTQRSVYTRDRNGPYAGHGLGSVVYDMVPASYVVSAVTSLAPQYALNGTATGSTYSSAGTTRIEYYYTGAKIQAGGRGFLGFREVASWDPQSGMLTRTTYRQDFPFVGLPEETRTWYKPSAPWTSSEATAAVGPCASPPCANTSIATNGVLLSRSVTTWAERATVAGLTHPYASRTEEWNYLPTYASGVLSASAFTGRSVTEQSGVDVYGNVGQVVSTTYTSTSGTGNMVARQTAVNTFTNNATTWHLGRLTCAVATSERTGQTAQTRRASFGYDATTGILNRETVQPTDCGTTGAQVNTTYTLDAFGNRLETTITAAGVAGSRRSRTVYDSRGRYPLRNEVLIAGVWRTVERSEGHSVFGTPARTIAAFGNTTTGVTTHHYFDAMGRPYYSYSPDGAWNRMRHGLGVPTGLSCPTGTVFHQRTDQGATGTDYIIAYACKDILGREIRRAARGFDGGWIFVDSRYDFASRPVEVSEPYISGQAAYWTRTAYDELGRVEMLRAPDPANGNPLQSWSLSTTGSGVNLAVRTTHTNELGQVHNIDRNALGEKISEVAPDGGITSYGYDALGNLLFTDGPLTGTVDRITIAYSALGHKTQTTDPDKGIWQYAYNGLGELICQRDAKSQATRFVQDELGRLISRTDLSGVASVTACTGTQRGITSWTYSSTAGASNFGQVTAESSQFSDGVGASHTTSRAYTYDGLGRTSQISTTILDGSFTRSYTERTTFDQHGRVFQSFDASGDSRGVRHVYNPRGYVSQLREAREGTAGQVYWTVQGMSARGQVTRALMGNGAQFTATHDAATGAVVQLLDSTGTTMAQDLLLVWDALGNLVSRRDWSGNRNQEERFFYDSRNRLLRTDSRVNAGTWVLNRQVQTYNVAGNVLTKTGLGTYAYGTTRPHAVTSAGGLTYTYDANGNVVSDTSGRTFNYTTYDLVRRVGQGTLYTEFHYDAGRQRTLKRELSGTTVSSRTHYVGAVEVVWNGSNPTATSGEYRRAIGGVLINTFFQSSGVSQQRYMHRDHLGSIVAISDASGLVLTWMSFDPWGLRRSADAWHPWNSPPSVYLNAMLAVTPRGFTGHEHVDSAGIIHMNGRIYDAKLGRFLQADPFVEDSTTLNRYTYVHNNPLAFTDPSGFFSLKKLFKLAVVIGIGVFTGGVGVGAFSLFGISGGLAGFGVAVAGGALAGAISTGTLEGALWGAFTAAVFTGIGLHVKGIADASTVSGVFGSGLNAGQFATAAIGSGVAGGTLSHLQGGKFGHGFISAGIGFSAGARVGRIGNPIGRGVATAVLGGTISRVTGGKFGNGAMTAAMAYAFAGLAAKSPGASGPQSEADTTDARLAQGVYDPDFAGVDGFTVVKRFVDDNGLQAVLFTDGNTNVLAFAGTKPSSWANWRANLRQAFGFRSAQYEMGLDIATSLYSDLKGNLRFTGHSLGGGLAAAAAIVTGGSATTFNAAGVHNNALRGFLRTNGTVRSYYSQFDVLRFGNAFTPASVPGQQISLGSAGFHGMSGVCNAMGC